MRHLLAVLLLAPGFATAADLPDPWVQRTETGWQARAMVAAGAACPTMRVDGAEAAMTVRAPAGGNFPITVCAADLPGRVQTLAVGGLTLPHPPARIDRIVVVGDTGCRLKGAAVQDCNDSAAWPWARLARQAAAQHPDLVIHVGDYHYRETPCPAGRAGCAGSPSGDTWEVWRLDMTSPAAPLLAIAPWLLVRGNHEMCNRGGEGWFRLYDPHPYSGCVDMTAPYRATLPGLDLLVLDSAVSDDRGRDPALIAAYRPQLAALLTGAPKGAWLLEHHPAWAIPQGAGIPQGARTNLTIQKAIAGLVPPELDLVLSGHIHDFASYDFGGARPAQLVVGNGGDANDGITEPPGPDTPIDGMAPTRAFTTAFYGYLLLEREGAGWKGTAYGVDGFVLARCAIAGRRIDCG